MARDFILEIGTEEIPARFMRPSLEQLKELAGNLGTEYRLKYEDIAAYGTPRRLVLYITGLAEEQQELSAEVKGPSKKVAFDQEGKPTKALQGFMKSQGITIDDITVKPVSGVDYVFAHKKAVGLATQEVLPEICHKIIHGLNFPKPMHWGNKEMRFARPIRWILALYDEEVIPFEIEGKASGRETMGHRFLSSGMLTVKSPANYFKVMDQNYVMVDQEQRRRLIWRQIQELAEKVGGNVPEDEELLEEVTFILEYPTALCGSFDGEYLLLPKEVVITPMREHQRYFPVFDAGGKLLNKFITVRNGTDKYLDVVREGNEKVLRARLADAKFFYAEDLKTPLADNVEKLKKIVFQDSLGTLFEKVERIIGLTEYLADEFGLTDLEAIANVKRAAYLSKADLVSNMVYEFTELQGIMGREYAVNNGEPKEVAQAIFEHYLPRFAGDLLPETQAGMIVSIADKIDTIVGCFSIGIIPTGSQDPYALRRQALGICHIILAGNISISLTKLITEAFNGYEGKVTTTMALPELQKEVVDFFKQRLKNIFGDRGLQYDTIDAVLDAGFDNFNAAWLRAEALAETRRKDFFDNLLATFNRVHSMAKNAGNDQAEKELFVEQVEENLWAEVKKVEADLLQLEENRDYKGILKRLAALQGPIDAFFDGVMVMDKDEKIKNNRLGLVKAVNKLFLQVADLSKIQVK